MIGETDWAHFAHVDKISYIEPPFIETIMRKGMNETSGNQNQNQNQKKQKRIV